MVGEMPGAFDVVLCIGTELGGYRTIVSVPMLKEDALLGVISIYRQQVRAFTDKETAPWPAAAGG